MDIEEFTKLQKRYSTGGTARGSIGPDTIGEDQDYLGANASNLGKGEN
jgi:hypothetical protein